MALIYFSSDYPTLYGCSFYDYREKPFEERSSKIVGWIYIATFFVIWTLYLPIIIVMLDRELLKFSCYKLMLFLAILDLNTSLYVGLWAGILSITGNVFCYWPNISFWIGCLNGMAWKAQCTAICLLAFNRCLEAFNEKWSIAVFEGKKTLLWICLPLIWGLHDIIWGPPALFNPISMMIMYNPHAGYFDQNNFAYTDKTLFYNNVFVSLTVPMTYAIFTCLILFKTKKAIGKAFAKQTKVFGQIFVISTFLFFISVGFVVIQFVRIPQSIFPWLQYTFLLFDGQPALIYLTLNETMRNRVKKLFFKKWNANIATAPIIQVTVNNSF